MFSKSNGINPSFSLKYTYFCSLHRSTQTDLAISATNSLCSGYPNHLISLINPTTAGKFDQRLLWELNKLTIFMWIQFGRHNPSNQSPPLPNQMQNKANQAVYYMRNKTMKGMRWYAPSALVWWHQKYESWE